MMASTAWLASLTSTLFADLDLAEVVRSKFDFDVVGHYARPDVFPLIVNEQPARSYRVQGNLNYDVQSK